MSLKRFISTLLGLGTNGAHSNKTSVAAQYVHCAKVSPFQSTVSKEGGILVSNDRNNAQKKFFFYCNSSSASVED